MSGNHPCRVIEIYTGPRGNLGPQGPSGSAGPSLPFTYVSGNTFSTTSSIEITGSLTVSGSNTFKNIGPAIFSGSVDISSSLNVVGYISGSFTGSLQGTSSYALNSSTSSYALTSSFEFSSSYSSTSSYASTASFLLNSVPPFPYTGSAVITGSLGITGSLNITGSAITLFSTNTSGGIISLGAGALNLGTIWANVATPDNSNFMLQGSATNTRLNGKSSIILSLNNTLDFITLTTTTAIFAPTTANSGAVTNFTFNTKNASSQTANLNIPNFIINGSQKQWNTGNITSQYWNYLSGNTASFVGSSVITSSYGLFVEEAIGGISSSITNNFAIGTSGSLYVSKNIGVQNTSPKDAVHIGINDGTLAGNIQLSYLNVIGASTAANIALGNLGANAFGYYMPCNAQGSSQLVNQLAGQSLNYQAYRHSFNFFQYNSPTVEWNTFVVNGINTRFNTSSIIPIQRWNYFGANTASFITSGSIINAYNLYVEAPVMGTGATASNNWALGTSGSLNVIGNINVLGTLIGGGGNWNTNGGNLTVIGTTTLWSTLIFQDAVNVTTGTTTGTKVGTATTQKIGFWNATPITQPTSGSAINELLANTGLIQSGSGPSRITNNLEVTGSLYVTSGITSSLQGTSSFANQVVTASYSIPFQFQSFSPSDATSYFVPSMASTPFTTDTQVAVSCPIAGVIRKASFNSRQSLGTSETSSFFLGINRSSYSLLSSNVKFDGNPNNELVATGSAINVNVGDTLTIRWDTPTWVTNPTGIMMSIILYIN